MLTGEHTSGEPYTRFKLEVELLKRLDGRSGIIPHLESDLPPRSDTETPAFLAMPIAKSINDVFNVDPTPIEDVVHAISSFAKTLSELHSEGTTHRDLKPDNLFLFKGDWAIGDFGIASFPGKPNLTPEGKRLGPYHFIAPEMMRDPANADGRMADVFSLAKTLWVLCTGQQYPIQGQIRRDIPSHRLSTHVNHRRIALIEGLIEDATADDPDRRPTMKSLHHELLAWMSPSIMRVAMPNVELIVKEVAELREASVRRRDADRELRSRFNDLVVHLRSGLRPIQETLVRMRLHTGRGHEALREPWAEYVKTRSDVDRKDKVAGNSGATGAEHGRMRTTRSSTCGTWTWTIHGRKRGD